MRQSELLNKVEQGQLVVNEGTQEKGPIKPGSASKAK